MLQNVIVSWVVLSEERQGDNYVLLMIWRITRGNKRIWGLFLIMLKHGLMRV